MTDMQTSLPPLIVLPSILNPVMHFSTQALTGEMKWPTSYTFALRIPFHLPKYWCHTSTKLHQVFWSSSWVNTWLDLPWNDMIHSISSHDLFGLSILTLLALHCCLGPSVPSLAQASPPCGPSLQSLNLPFTIAADPSSQALSWSSPLWSHDSMSCLICNEFLHHTIWA